MPYFLVVNSLGGIHIPAGYFTDSNSKGIALIGCLRVGPVFQA